MTKWLWLIIAILLSVGIYAGIDNQAVTKTMSGTTTVTLEPNRKLVSLSWKDNNLWVLSRNMKPREAPNVYHYDERSRFGVLEGRVIVIESKVKGDSD